MAVEITFSALNAKCMQERDKMITSYYLIFLLYDYPIKIPMKDYKSCTEARIALKDNIYISSKSLSCINTGY